MSLSDLYKRGENGIITAADDVAGVVEKIIPFLNSAKPLVAGLAELEKVLSNPIVDGIAETLFPSPALTAVLGFIKANADEINSSLKLGAELTDASLTPEQKAQAIIAALPKSAQGLANSMNQLLVMISADVKNGSLSAADAAQIYGIVKPLL